MVASTQLENPYYGVIGRQRGREIGGLAQAIERTAFPSIRKYFLPAAKRLGANWIKSAASKFAEIVEKVSRARQKVWEGKLWENNWVVVVNRGQ